MLTQIYELRYLTSEIKVEAKRRAAAPNFKTPNTAIAVPKVPDVAAKRGMDKAPL